MAIKKPFKMKTTNGTLTCSQSETGVYTFEGRRRLTRKEKKAGVTVDEEKIVLTFKVGVPDGFKCAHMTVVRNGDVDELMVKEFMTQIDNVILDEEIVFFRVSNQEMGNDEELATALRKAGFVQDNKDPDIMEYEQNLIDFGAVWMSLGCSLGVIFGIHYGMQYMAIFIGAGLAIGGGLSASTRKKRAELKKARGYNITKSKTE